MEEPTPDNSELITRTVNNIATYLNPILIFPKFQIYSGLVSLGLYITATTLLYYTEEYHKFVTSFGVHNTLVTAFWICMIGYVKLCFYLRISYRKSTLIKFKVVSFGIEQIALVIFTICTTSMWHALAGLKALIAISCLFLSVWCVEIFFLTDKDFNLAQSLYNLINSLAMTLIPSQWTPVVSAAINSIRATVMVFLGESAMLHLGKLDVNVNEEIRGAISLWKQFDDMVQQSDHFREFNCSLYVELGRKLDEINGALNS